MQNVHESNHPLIKDLVNKIRDVELDSNLFRKYVGAIAKILLFEALKDEKLEIKEVNTWIGKKEFGFLPEENYVFIPILRAGLPMLDGIIEIMPLAKAGFLAMKRDETTFKSILYYKRLPDLENKTAIILDPMVATGGSLHDAVSEIKKDNPKRIITLNIVGVNEGLFYVSKSHPDIDVYIAQIDERLNDKKYIIPGIGDAGDRAFNTL